MTMTQIWKYFTRNFNEQVSPGKQNQFTRYSYHYQLYRINLSLSVCLVLCLCVFHTWIMRMDLKLGHFKKVFTFLYTSERWLMLSSVLVFDFSSLRRTRGCVVRWPTFIPVCNSLFDPAGDTVEAQSVTLAAKPLMCCMGDRLRIPMNVVLFSCIDSITVSSISSRVSTSSGFFLPSFLCCSCINIHLFCSFLSFVPLSHHCVTWSLLLAVVLTVWAEGCQLQQVWAVRSFVTPLPKTEHLLLMLPSSLSFCVSLSQCISLCPLHICCPCCSVLDSNLSRNPHRPVMVWFTFPKCQTFIRHEAPAPDKLSCWLSGCSHMMESYPDLDFMAGCYL